ncbi:MAG: hypothetical protein KJ047_13045 [Anaerolineae bacterium]|nr:hypothetical protein [Anaerolineae bacterium]MEB2287518.1 hypothetical protein [Anaerolineae bacterium]
MDDLESLWSGLLSQRAELIRAAWAALSHHERRAVHEHLMRMTTEDGWTAPQQKSARIALDVLDAQPPHEPGQQP